ncbi:MAG: hypothetical protein DMF87_08560, partial [Acidobacteria bacterium]
MQEHRLHRGWLGGAVVCAAAVIGSSPYIGDIRSAILAAFPTQFRLIIGGAIATAVIAALVYALGSIRDRRAWRYTGLGVAIGGAVLYARLVATGNLLVDVVEHVHFVEYGVIVLNLVSVTCGLCFAASVDPPARFSIPLVRRVLRPIAYGVSVVLLAFAGFFHAVHLGHQVYEPDIGVFWSHYDAQTLLAESTDRANRWRSNPPTEMRRLSHEDQYLSEALWHVQERNRAWGAGDQFSAWRENLILERFYAPVLDTPTFASRTPSRWPAPQRDDAAARIASDPGI